MLAAEAGALAIVGSNSSDLSMAIAEEAEARGLVQVSNVSTAQELTWNPTTGRDRRLRLPGLQLRRRHGPAARRVRARHPRSAARGGALRGRPDLQRPPRPKVFVERFREAGSGRTTAEFVYLALETDFRSQLRAVIAPSRPDVLFLPGSFTDATLIADQGEGPRASPPPCSGPMPGRARSCSSGAARRAAPTSWITARPPRASTSATARRSASPPRAAGPCSRTTRCARWRPASAPWGRLDDQDLEDRRVAPRGGACATPFPPRISRASPVASASTAWATARPGMAVHRGGARNGRPPGRRASTDGWGSADGAAPAWRPSADLSLNAKVTLTLIAIFVVDRGRLPAVPRALPRASSAPSLLEKDKRLLATLRDNYERDFIYDLLSANEESLGRPPGRPRAAERPPVGAGGVGGHRPRGHRRSRRHSRAPRGGGRGIRGRADPGPAGADGTDGPTSSSAGGRPLLSKESSRARGAPGLDGAGRSAPCRSTDMRGTDGPSLYFGAELAAAGRALRAPAPALLAGRPPAQPGHRPTPSSTASPARPSCSSCILLNLLISRIVIAPVRNVQQAMSRAATGDLDVRLPVHSRTSSGPWPTPSTAWSAELFASKREVEDYSHNLETMVAARTHALQESEADLLDLKNRLATVLANVATGVVSLDEEGRIETFNERAGEILATPANVTRAALLGEVLEGDTRRVLDLVEAVRSGRDAARAGPPRLPASRAGGARCRSWSRPSPARAGPWGRSWSARTSPRSSPPSASKPGRKRWSGSSTSSRTR